MTLERRNDFDRRRTERRRAGRIVKLTDSNFDKEMRDVPVFGLVLFISARSRKCKQQELAVRQIAQDFKPAQMLRVGLFELKPESMTVPAEYGVKRAPTLMLLRDGEVVYQSSRLQSRDSLRKKISATITLDARVFVERRHGAERRRTARRVDERKKTVEKIVWRDLLEELKTSPWPIVLSIDPDDPLRKREFSTLVDTVADRLRIPGLRTLHVTGSPSATVRKQFRITVDPPGVAVFLDGKLAGQFPYLGSKVTLKKRFQEILA